MGPKPYNLLFLCTGNSARSILAEALLNTMGQGRFCAYSAGSFPTGVVNPVALEQCQDLGYSPAGLRSKAWAEFAPGDGTGTTHTVPIMDFIITVCDNAEGKSCPVWPGHPITAHWGLPDPAAATGDDAGKRQAFAAAREAIAGRIRLLLALPLDTMDRDEIACALREIGDDTQTTEGGRLDHP